MVPAANGSFLCLECGTRLSHIKSVFNHVLEMHVDASAIYGCPMCAKIIRRRRGFVKHLRVMHAMTKETLNETDLESMRVVGDGEEASDAVLG